MSLTDNQLSMAASMYRWSQEGTSMKQQILVVEDDTSIAQTLLLMLKTLPNVEVRRAHDGEEGLAFWHQQPADLLLTDNNMRGMTGIDLVRTLRTEGFEQPMLMITAYDSVALQREARSVGVTELITKPFFFDELLDKVRSLLTPKAVSR
jgi:CheY-like chemotaxis protein